MRRYFQMKYRLTEMVERHGCSCKLPQRDLEDLLTSLQLDKTTNPNVLIGVGDDAAVIRISSDQVLVQHLDFFTPIIDDPYVQGKIAACNSISDVYSKGATDIVSMLMIMGITGDMPEDIVKEQILGFRDLCDSVEAPVVGGQTIYSGWPILGGAASGLSRHGRYISNSGVRVGDVLILTKPLGTQPVMAALRLSQAEQQWLEKRIDSSQITQAVDDAIRLMCTPNKAAAEVLAESEAHACTDITGFGLMGHAGIMARRSQVDITVHELPVISGAVELARALKYELECGRSAETSGGLLISVPQGKAVDNLVSRLERDGVPSYQIGYASKGTGSASLVAEPTLLEIVGN